MTRILLIDDDEVIAEIIRFYLKAKDSYEVLWAATAHEGLSMCRDAVDLILLDVRLPDVNGIKLCSTLRSLTKAPILLVSCINDKNSIVEGLRNGADDYITKPFDCDELNARIESHLRRVALDGPVPSSSSRVIEQPGFTFDTVTMRIDRAEGSFSLTLTEFDILSYFVFHPEQVVSAEDLYEHVWKSPCPDELRTIVVHISNLRKKLGDGENGMRFIHNIRGYGYYYKPVQIRTAN